MRRRNVVYPLNFFREEEEELKDLQQGNASNDKDDDDQDEDQDNRQIPLIKDYLPTEQNEADRIFSRTYYALTSGDKVLKTEGDLITTSKTTEREYLIAASARQFQNKFYNKQITKPSIDFGWFQDELHQDTSIEKGLDSKFYSEKLMIFDYTIMLFAIWQFISFVIYYESDFQDTHTDTANYCLWLILVCTAFEIVITLIRYQTLIELELAQKRIHSFDDLFTTQKYKAIIYEVLTLLIQPYPFFNRYTFTTYNYVNEIEFQFKYNWLLTIGGWFRLYIVIRVILKSTSYMNASAARISRMYGCQADYQYAIKCLFKDYPIILSLLVFLCSIFVFGYCLYISEKPMIYVMIDMDETFLFDSILNSIWCTIITMTTIGYGDFFPRTSIGRSIIVVLTIWGAFVVSLMVVVLNNALEMDAQESRSLLLLKRLSARNELQRRAAALVSAKWRFKTKEKVAVLKGMQLSREYYISKALELRGSSRYFREQHMELKALNEDDNMDEEMSRQFDFVRDDIKNLLEDQQKLNQYIEMNFKVEH